MSYVSEPVWRCGEQKSSPLRRRWSFTVSPVNSTPSKLCANAGKSCPQKLSRHIHFVLSISAPSNSSCQTSFHVLPRGRRESALPGTAACFTWTTGAFSISGLTNRASALIATKNTKNAKFKAKPRLESRE